MEQKWWHDAVVYQIYPRSFYDSNNDGIGDLAGIIEKLDYLATLGINVLWLSPVYQSPMDDNGYDISDYQAIAAEFGTMQEMKQLLDEAKRRDIKVVMDLVVNHTSDEHPWFIEACKSKSNPFRDYYIWRDAVNGGVPDDFGSVFGGSAWQWHENTQQYYFHLFSKKQPDLNWENNKVHTEIHNMMNYWIDLGIGGFRLDVIDLIGKEIDNHITGNGPRLHSLLKEMNHKTFGQHDLLTVGETWDATPEIAKLYSNPNRDELSMVFQFEHISLTWKNGDKWDPIDLNLSQFKQVLTKWQVELADEGWNSLFWNNHDLPRVVSKYGDETTYRVQSAKMLATTMHCLKGTPYIYQGEEIGMTNVQFDNLDDYRDIETLNFYNVKTESGVSHDAMMQAIHLNSRDNARTPMQWNNEEHGGFTKGTPWIKANPNHKDINVVKALNDKESIFYHYQKLIQLRKQMPVIVYGDFTPLYQEHDKVFAYLREDKATQIMVMSNFSAETITLHLPNTLQNSKVHCHSYNYMPIEQLSTSITLQPYESFMVEIIS